MAELTYFKCHTSINTSTLPAILKRQPLLPKEIIDIPEEYTEDDYSLYITMVDYPTVELTFDLMLEENNDDEESIYRKWTIQTTGHRKNHISFDRTANIDLKYDHPLLWQFTDTQCQLYFKGQCSDPTKLFYDLFVAHKSLFKNFQPFNISFGHEINISNRFQFHSGLLTEGPKKLMEKYAHCLKQNGLDYTIIGDRPAMQWDGDKFISEPDDLKVLILGDSYIIAQDFAFTQRD